MYKKYLYIFLVMLLTFVNSRSYATDEKSSESDVKVDNSISGHLSDEYLEKADQDKDTEYQKIISDYKNYLSDVKPEVMEEIREYRKEIVKINKQKRDLFNALSGEAQRYLAKEDEMKKKLPINKADIR